MPRERTFQRTSDGRQLICVTDSLQWDFHEQCPDCAEKFRDHFLKGTIIDLGVKFYTITCPLKLEVPYAL